MAVVAPMPRARVTIAVNAKTGAFRSWRSASRRSASMRSSERRWCCFSDVGIRKVRGGGSVGCQFQQADRGAEGMTCMRLPLRRAAHVVVAESAKQDLRTLRFGLVE